MPDAGLTGKFKLTHYPSGGADFCDHVCMKIRVESGRLQIVQGKWLVLAIGALSAALCLGVGAGSAILLHARPDAPRWFLYVFSGGFLIAGLSILVTLPRVCRRAWRNDGALVFEADREGAGGGHGFGRPLHRWPWSAIEEIVIAERVRIRDRTETSYQSRRVLLFLTSEAVPQRWIDQIRVGLERTGQGRAYVSAAFPRRQGTELLASLRGIAPGRIAIRHVQRAMFDRKQSTDQFES
jgi:hypothetical protein